jgi:hypothetical protein
LAGFYIKSTLPPAHRLLGGTNHGPSLGNKGSKNTIFSKAGSGSDKGKQSKYMYKVRERGRKKRKESNHYITPQQGQELWASLLQLQWIVSDPILKLVSREGPVIFPVVLQPCLPLGELCELPVQLTFFLVIEAKGTGAMVVVMDYVMQGVDHGVG